MKTKQFAWLTLGPALLLPISLNASEPLAQPEHVKPNLPAYNKTITSNHDLGSMGSVKTLIAKAKIDDYEKSLRDIALNNPDSAQAKSRLAGFLLSQNKASESIPFYQEAITLAPDNPKLFAAISVAYLHQARYKMAKAMADEALRLAPEMSQAKKLNEYIEAKQEVLEMVEKAATTDQLTPNDGLHTIE
ncbi:MAG: hypothetical protein V3V09_03360 [Arenicellales bacterium]